jgi:hypothetical protein
LPDVKVERKDNHPIRTLLLFLGAGAGIFALGLFVILLAISGVGHSKVDSSMSEFYPLVAGAGALFGLERWMYYESGGVNPFHDP